MVDTPSEQAMRRVIGWQERAFGELAEAMGLGWQPLAAAKRILNWPQFDVDGNIAQIKEAYGPAVTGIDFDASKQFVASEVGRMLSEIKSPYEDTASILMTRVHLHSLLDDALWGDSYSIPLRPFVAGMPSLGMNPLSRAFISTGEAVILIQNSMLDYLAHFASAVSSLLPPDWFPRSGHVKSVQSVKPDPDRTLLEAQEHLRESLAAYVIGGTPRDVGHMALAGPLNQWRSNLLGCSIKFVIAHEVAHIMAGHLTGTPPTTRDEHWVREYDADYIGMMAVLTSGARSGVDLQTSFVGCIVTLLATYTVDIIVRLLQYGTTEVGGSATHPDPIDRAAMLVNRTKAQFDQDGAAEPWKDILERFQQLGSVVMSLVAHCIGIFERAYEAGIRPAEIWRLQAPPE